MSAVTTRQKGTAFHSHESSTRGFWGNSWAQQSSTHKPTATAHFLPNSVFGGKKVTQDNVL